MDPITPLIFALIGLGAAVYFMSAENQYTRAIGRYMVIITSLLAVWAIHLLLNQPNWTLALIMGLIGLFSLFWILDVIMPIVNLLYKKGTKRRV